MKYEKEISMTNSPIDVLYGKCNLKM